MTDMVVDSTTKAMELDIAQLLFSNFFKEWC